MMDNVSASLESAVDNVTPATKTHSLLSKSMAEDNARPVIKVSELF